MSYSIGEIIEMGFYKSGLQRTDIVKMKIPPQKYPQLWNLHSLHK